MCLPCVRQQHVSNGSSLEAMATPVPHDTQSNSYGQQRRTKNKPKKKIVGKNRTSLESICFSLE